MMSERKKIMQFAILLIALIGCGIGDGLLAKANIGINPWESISLSLNRITAIPVGTLSIIINSSCVLIQILLERKVTARLIMRVPAVIIMGMTINEVVYSLFGQIVLTAYYQKFIMMILGILFSAVSIGVVMSLNLIVFPLEGLLSYLSERVHIPFSRLEQGAQIFGFAFSLIMMLIFHFAPTLREGSLITILLMAPVMNWTMQTIRKMKRKKHVLIY